MSAARRVIHDVEMRNVLRKLVDGGRTGGRAAAALARLSAAMSDGHETVLAGTFGGTRLRLAYIITDKGRELHREVERLAAQPTAGAKGASSQ